MAAVKCYNYLITLSCLVGLGLSIYAFIVEEASANNKNYVAMCDISEHMSCSKVFTTSYGKGFGFLGKILGEDSKLNAPNCFYGILAYSLLATLAQSSSLFITKLSFILVILSNIASIYFASILYFILKNFCIICVSTYVVSFVNLILTYKKLNLIKKLAQVDERKKKY